MSNWSAPGVSNSKPAFHTANPWRYDADVQMFYMRPPKYLIFWFISVLSNLLQTTQGPKVTTEMCVTMEQLYTFPMLHQWEPVDLFCREEFKFSSTRRVHFSSWFPQQHPHTSEALAYLSGTGLSPHPPAEQRSPLSGAFFFSHQRLGKANSLRAMCDLLSFFSPPSSLSVIVRTLQLKMRMLLQTTEYWRAFHACYCSVTVCTYVSRAYWEGHYPWVRAAPLSAEISFISALISTVMMPPDLRDLFKSLNLSYRAVNVKATAFIWKETLSLQYDCSFYFFKDRFKVHL